MPSSRSSPEAELIETRQRADGKVELVLTPKGAQVGRMLAMGHEDDADAVLDALLDSLPADR